MQTEQNLVQFGLVAIKHSAERKITKISPGVSQRKSLVVNQPADLFGDGGNGLGHLHSLGNFRVFFAHCARWKQQKLKLVQVNPKVLNLIGMFPSDSTERDVWSYPLTWFVRLAPGWVCSTPTTTGSACPLRRGTSDVYRQKTANSANCAIPNNDVQQKYCKISSMRETWEMHTRGRR